MRKKNIDDVENVPERTFRGTIFSRGRKPMTWSIIRVEIPESVALKYQASSFESGPDDLLAIQIGKSRDFLFTRVVNSND